MATKRAEKPAPAGPYCYALVDPADGRPFYIGKGRRARMYQHVKEATHGKAGPKCDRIRWVLAAGRQIEYKVLGEYETDAEALVAERGHIAAHEGLTNLTAGGEGGSIDPKVRMSNHAARLLAKMMPLDHWLLHGQPDAVGRAMIKMAGCPIEAYNQVRNALEEQVRNPSPNVLCVDRDGRAVLEWE